MWSGQSRLRDRGVIWALNPHWATGGERSRLLDSKSRLRKFYGESTVGADGSKPHQAGETMSDKVYCRSLEDNSGFVVCFGGFLPPKPYSIGGRDRWEQVLGIGSTRKEAWTDYRRMKV